MRRTIDSLKQHGGPKDTSPSNAMRKQDYDRNRYLQFQTIKKKPLRKSTNRIITSETKRKTTWLDGTK